MGTKYPRYDRRGSRLGLERPRPSTNDMGTEAGYLDMAIGYPSKGTMVLGLVSMDLSLALMNLG